MFNQVGLFDETLKIVLKICEKQTQQAIFKTAATTKNMVLQIGINVEYGNL